MMLSVTQRMLRLLAIWTLVFAGFAAPLQASEAAWQALKDGGIVVFRHALAPGTGDPDNFQISDCATQRNLNDEGRDQARRIGTAFRERGVVVGRVLASQWCRSSETAELAFPGQVTAEPAFNSFFRNRSRAEPQTRDARQMLMQWDGPGAIVVVTHQVNISALTGEFTRSGEGIVLVRDGDQLHIVGSINP